MPFETVSSYVERDTLSQSLEAALGRDYPGQALAHAVAVYGLGGTGKSQLVLRYVEKHKDDYQTILWIDARTQDTALTSFERCCQLLCLAIPPTSEAATPIQDRLAVKAIIDWLIKRKGPGQQWLVVMDNADEADRGVRKIISRGSPVTGTVIVTSRDSQSSKLFNKESHKIEVAEMNLSEASSLLLRRTCDTTGQDQDELGHIAALIASQLGSLALAVDLAGARIVQDMEHDQANAATAMERYLGDFQRHQDELLRSNALEGLTPYEQTVWTVWDASLTTIQKRHRDQSPVRLLQFLARFDRTNIPDELFRRASFGLRKLDLEKRMKSDELPEWLRRVMPTRPDQSLTRENVLGPADE